jgi:hypothetical protein
MLLAALLGRPEGPAVSLAEQSAGAVGDYLDWAAKVRTWSPSGVDPLDATLVHLFHGSFENREYDTRNRLLAGFDPATDVATAGSGLAEWSDRARTERQDMIDAVSQYFSRRREDDG